ncbi:MAG TPA: guanylate kinase [Pseudonocardiaceae bacterium]
MSGTPSERGRLVVLVGPSGVGKTSVVHRLRELYPDLWFSVSVTTRARRSGEIDGRDYHFISDAEFDRMIERGELLEWAAVHGGSHRSGTPREPIERRLASGRPALLEVDLQGARAVRRAMPEALTVFIAPPSWPDLVRRLVGRGTESREMIDRRLRTAREELAARDEFDVEIINDDVQHAAEDLLTLIVGSPASNGSA